MNELDWLTENRPEPPEPDTAWARASLLAHIEAETGEFAADEPTAPSRAERALVAAAGDELAAAARVRREAADAGRRAAGRRDGADAGRRAAGRRREGAAAGGRCEADAARRSSRRRAPRRAAAVAVLALSALAAAVAWPTGDFRTPPVPGLHAPAPAEAALVKLSKRVAQAPAPKGDATLIVRSHHFPDGRDFQGYDLYLDDGRYYYGATAAELKAAGLNTDYNDLVVKAALAARSLPTDQARQRMIDATWGGKEPTAADNPPAAAAKAASKLKGAGNWAPASEKTIDENRIWFGSTDALLAGSGRADIRAGVLLLLSTIDTVKVTEQNGTLKLTATDYPDGYAETYYVDAKTGVPQKFVGGVPGETPGVTVTYDIKRVTAANWADAAA